MPYPEVLAEENTTSPEVGRRKPRAKNDSTHQQLNILFEIAVEW